MGGRGLIGGVEYAVETIVLSTYGSNDRFFCDKKRSA